MSYQVLARKYRPKNFTTLVGQEHVVRALTHALASGRLHHAYLFTGTRGVGKTTLSRILAKSFNCTGENGEGGITASPCGACTACRAIDEGRFVDYIEMDAASNRGVDEMAALLEQAIYAPSNARFKVYMIDEVHMLTSHAFNAMLKTLEEPPPHIKFILATTDPQKIPVTVLSRCLQFNLKQMPPGHIIGHLSDILTQEQISFAPAALRLLAQGAQGSMRDALSLTDQAIAYAAGEVTLEAVQAMLGALDQTYLIRILDALAQNNGVEMLAVADEMAARSLSYQTALQDLAGVLHKIALAQTVPAALADDIAEREQIIRLAETFSAEQVQLYYQIAIIGRNELSLAPDEYAGFTMTLLRMLAFWPDFGASSEPPPAAITPAAANAAAETAIATAAKVSAPPRPLQNPARAALEAARSGNSGTSQAAQKKTEARADSFAIAGEAGAAATALAARPAQAMHGAAELNPGQPEPPELNMAASSPAALNPTTLNPTTLNPAISAALKVAANITAKAAARSQAPADNSDALNGGINGGISGGINVAAPAAPSIVDAPEFMPQPLAELEWDGDWPALAAQLPLRGVVAQLAAQSELSHCDSQAETITFHLKVALDTLGGGANQEKLTAALNERFAKYGKTIRTYLTFGAVSHTAHARELARREALQHVAEQQIQTDPFVLAMQREFGAVIVPGSILARTNAIQ